jgi:putative oxidoreductase
MKYLPTIAGALLGLLFIASGVVVLFNLVTMPAPPAGTPMASFMDAFGPTGYMKFVKVCEILGGILVAIPLTRNWGLLILGPILVNILAFHVFVGGGDGLKDPVLIVLSLLAAYLLWNGRAGFLGLLGRARPTAQLPESGSRLS